MAKVAKDSLVELAVSAPVAGAVVSADLAAPASVQTEPVSTAALVAPEEPAVLAVLAVVAVAAGPADLAVWAQGPAAMVAPEGSVVLGVSAVAAAVVALAALVEWVTVVAVQQDHPAPPASAAPAGTALSSWSFK